MVGVSLMQSGRFGIVATPYEKPVTVLGLGGDFKKEIHTDLHPAGAFHIKTKDTEELLIITAPVPWE